MRIDERQRRVWLVEVEVTLTPRELALLLILARAGGRVVPKHRLSHLLNPLGESVDFAAIEVHVHHLRRKLGEERIRTVRGLGYRLPLGDEHAVAD
ncbi:winged helix-turn-helix domain-containing protein [Thiocystis minor]|uniref:winged helix-turn-helix domain-containing protein n=1 Tax=Thiocystis minor TaxID=61597 RepID=UPI00191480FB|nr:winged helix-turn-helix domain-containing protein [Thiocystis minor]